MSKRGPLPGRLLSRSISTPDGDPAVKIDVLDVVRADQLDLTFEDVGPRWRQGVFLATDGDLVVGETRSPSLVIWSDTAPRVVSIEVGSADGRLIVYNIWDSGREKRPFESLSATSGMLVETLSDGSRRYSCTDVGREPDFGRLVFRLAWR